jgi:hypothetical protein
LVIPENLLHEGDLVFRLGRGTSSRIVNMADNENSFSHIGILVKNNSEWYVIHSVPGEENETNGKEVIKCDPVKRFFANDRTIYGVVMRWDSIHAIEKQIVDNAKSFYQQKLLFDHNYTLSDSTALYCTELVHRVFLKQNVDLSENRRHSFPLFKEQIIFPSDILKNKRLHEICKINKTKICS